MILKYTNTMGGVKLMLTTVFTNTVQRNGSGCEVPRTAVCVK